MFFLFEVCWDGIEIECVMKDIKFFELSDICGDLYMYIIWLDGVYVILEMIEVCIVKGYEYMVIIDYGKFLWVVNGLDEKRLLE